MIPFRDHNPSSRTPFVVIGLVALNVLIFLGQLVISASGGMEQLYDVAALIPYQLINNPVAEAPTIFSSMFMHGGWGHLLGNMVYLWIFGDNIEDTFGHVGFLLFYLVCGVAADISHVALEAGSTIPTIGASGAISGVLGAYLVRYPRARVDAIIFLGGWGRVVPLSALIVLGGWFVLQLFEGVLSMGVEGAGIAYFAHIGGFVTGLALMGIYSLMTPGRR